MKRLMVGTGLVVFLFSTRAHAQSADVTPQADAGHASQVSCVILKRMGRIGRTESRLYHLGISGKQFRYVEGKLPEGLSFHGKMTDHDVRNLQAHGAQVLVLDSHYTSEDLKQARASCQGEAGKTTIQAEVKAPLGPASASVAGGATPVLKPSTAKAPAPKTNDAASSMVATLPSAGGAAPAAKPPKAKEPAPKAHELASSNGATEAALVDVSSTPAGADIYIDERFSGRTPATTIILMPGDHKISIKKDGFAVWKRKLKLPGGRISVEAELHPKTK